MNEAKEMSYLDSFNILLTNRFESVLGARPENLCGEVKIFYDFVNSKDLTKNILIELESKNFDLSDVESLIKKGKRFINFKTPSDYKEKIYYCNYIMRKFAGKELDYLDFLGFSSNMHEVCLLVCENYLEPVYKYIIEKIVSVDVFLYLLLKYKNKIEWFKREKLYSLYNNDTSKGEDSLTKNFQEYLLDQGVDYPFSTPKSPKGRADLVTYLGSADPLAIEVKLFNPEKGLNKEHIKQGIRQAYEYAKDYGSANGYLLIFNTINKELIFDGTEKESKYNKMEFMNKMIFIVVVNIARVEETASKTKKIEKVIINVNKIINKI